MRPLARIVHQMRLSNGPSRQFAAAFPRASQGGFGQQQTFAVNPQSDIESVAAGRPKSTSSGALPRCKTQPVHIEASFGRLKGNAHAAPIRNSIARTSARRRAPRSGSQGTLALRHERNSDRCQTRIAAKSFKTSVSALLGIRALPESGHSRFMPSSPPLWFRSCRG